VCLTKCLRVISGILLRATLCELQSRGVSAQCLVILLRATTMRSLLDGHVEQHVLAIVVLHALDRVHVHRGAAMRNRRVPVRVYLGREGIESKHLTDAKSTYRARASV